MLNSFEMEIVILVFFIKKNSYRYIKIFFILKKIIFDINLLKNKNIIK